jgi:hypothetical protein
VVFAEFGRVPYHKRKGTTDCVIAPLEAFYKLVSEKDGIVNGVPITDRRFHDFATALLGDGREWVDALVGRPPKGKGEADALPPMGQEMTDMQALRVGDLVQLEGHRAFVAAREIDYKGVLTSVLLFDANVPWKGQDFRTQSAVHENRSVPVKAIKYAVGLYDLASRPAFGAVVNDVTPSAAESLRLTKPEGSCGAAGHSWISSGAGRHSHWRRDC